MFIFSKLFCPFPNLNTPTHFFVFFSQRRFRLWLTDCRYRASISSSDHQCQNLIFLLESCKQTAQTAEIHGLMIKTGLESIPFPLSKLLSHCSTQDIHYASLIFKTIKEPNLYMCNTMLKGYLISNEPKMSLVLFCFMMTQNHRLDLFLDQFTFVSVLKSCARLLAFRTGLGVHAVILKYGFDLFLNVKNSLLNFYCVCGIIKDANMLFVELGNRRDLISWNTLIGGYLNVSQFNEIVDLFRKLCRDGLKVRVTTILGVLSAIRELKIVYLGRCLHVYCMKDGFAFDLKVASALISMYGKHGDTDSARQIFDETDANGDVVLWNCLIDGYAKNGLLEKALELIQSMNQNGVMPNSSTLAGLLSACSEFGAHAIGYCVHDFVKEQHVDIDLVLGTTLVDMYAKSGLLEKAIDVFETMEIKDVRSWTAMISGYGAHGQASRAVMLFQRMEEEGFIPNEVTILAVLNSCSHGGLIFEGTSIFKKMVTHYHLRPNIEHYGCIIDAFGRAGLLEEALNFIKALPIDTDATAWRALLAACRVYGKLELVGLVQQELNKLCDKHPADLLSIMGTYVSAGMTPHFNINGWEKEHQLMIKEGSVQSCKKETGCSTIVLCDEGPNLN